MFMNCLRTLSSIILLFVLVTLGCSAQGVRMDTVGRKGESRRSSAKSSDAQKETDGTKVIPDDSVYVFVSPVPLAGSPRDRISDPTSFIIRLAISGNGYGLGLGYAYEVSSKWGIFADMIFSGARNTSELEFQDPVTLAVFVPNKVNSLYIAPFCLGVRYTIPKDYVAENIAPYISAGAGSSAVIRAPYNPFTGDVFSSLGQSITYARPAGFVGAGILIESTESNYVSLDARYYLIPFGGEGLESIRGKPMKDFNGFFLTLAIGIR